MKTPQEKEFLLDYIQELEMQRDVELRMLKHQVHQTIAELNPLYFIKNILTETVEIPEIKGDIIQSIVDFTSHFLSKNTILGVFQKPIKKILRNGILLLIKKLSPKQILDSSE
jgi:hypothetical protein